MTLLRGRAFIRAWTAERGDGPKAAMVGIAECTADVEDEVIAGHAILSGPTGTTLVPTGTRGSYLYDIGAHDVGSILTSCDWPRPSRDTGLDGGGMLLRRTRAPSAPGTVACVIVALLSTDEMQDQTIVDISGGASGTLVIGPRQCARHLGTNGQTLSQIMQRPLWGWSGEPWGLVSCLRLDVVDACRRIEEIRDGAPEAFAGETQTLENEHTRSVLGTGRRDDEYQRYRRLYREMHGPMPHADVRTAEEQKEHDRTVEQVVRRMMRRDLAA